MRRPTPFGKYYLLDRVNVGGMAEVFRAKATGVEGFEKLVAIKRILPNIAEDDEFITMFIDEAKISVQLSHANVAQIYDLGKIDESYFIAMEFIAGKDLRTIFERARKKGEILPIPMSCYVVARVCEGLDYAHRKKDSQGQDLHIVHRDVSPQNILVSYEGEVKLIDFGIAKAANKASKTQAGILKGKFGYMSPEQVRGLPIDRRSDVFSVGIVLYELLTGERLFVGESDFSTLEKVRNVEIMPPTTYNRRIPPELETIVLRALAREAEERYQSAAEVHEDLSRLLASSSNIFSRRDLAHYMKQTFADDIGREEAALSQFRESIAQPTPDEVALLGRATPLGGGQNGAPKPTLPSVLAGDDPAALLLPGADDDSATRVYDAREMGGLPSDDGAAPPASGPPPLPPPLPSSAPQPFPSPRAAPPPLPPTTNPSARAPMPLTDLAPPALDPFAAVSPAAERAEPVVVVPVVPLETGVASMPERPRRPPAKNRRRVLGTVTAVAMLGALVVLFIYLRSVDGLAPVALTVTTTPGAKLQLCTEKGCKALGIVGADGRFVGAHAAGTFRLVAEREGCEGREASVTLVASQDNGVVLGDLACSAAAGSGGVRVESVPPGAKLAFLRADLATWAGPTPYARAGVPAGEYVVELSSEGYFTKRTTLRARPGAETRSEVKLQARRVKLSVSTRPAGAAVVVRSKGKGIVARAPETPATLTIERATESTAYEVELSKKGYLAHQAAVAFTGDPNQALSAAPIELEAEEKTPSRRPKPRKPPKPTEPAEPKPEEPPPKGDEPTKPPVTEYGTLDVNLKGAWAYVHLDGRNTGKTTPLIGLRLKTGRYRITLVRDELGYHNEFWVDIAPNRVTRAFRQYRPRE